MEAVALTIIILIAFTLLAAVEEGIEKTRDSRAWGAVVCVAILLDEIADRVRLWRSSRKAVRLINRYESARTPW